MRMTSSPGRLAAESGGPDVTVNVVELGTFATETNAVLVAAQRRNQRLGRQTSLGGERRPGEISARAVFLASETALRRVLGLP